MAASNSFEYVFKLLWIVLSFVSLSGATTYTNPIRNPEGSDPFIVYTGGYYYFLTTTWTDVEISRATTLEGLKTSTKKVVYSTTTADRCCNVWSPEVHYIDSV
jgi:GH43 family beta-xylosidase